jgi:hypothetical protein
MDPCIVMTSRYSVAVLLKYQKFVFNIRYNISLSPRIRNGGLVF